VRSPHGDTASICSSTGSGPGPHRSRTSTNTHVVHSAGIPSPCIISLSEFRRSDIYPKRQRLILTTLEQNEPRVKQEMASRFTLSRIHGKIKKEKNSGKGSTKDSSKKPSGMTRLNAFLKSKKSKRTRAGIFHLLHIAVHDQKTSLACTLLEELSTNTLRKKRAAEANRIFLLAMANNMESVCMLMLEKGFPKDLNAGIFGVGSAADPNAVSSGTSSSFGGPSGNGSLEGTVRISNGTPVMNNTPPTNSSINSGNNSSTVDSSSKKIYGYPSYFLVAIGLGLDNVVRVMMKQKVNVNHSWYGLTPLHIACAKGNINAAIQLIENGADPFPILPLAHFELLRGLKSDPAKLMSRRHTMELGRQWIPQGGGNTKRFESTVSAPQRGNVSTNKTSSALGSEIESTNSSSPDTGNEDIIKAQKIPAKYMVGKGLSPLELAAVAGHYELVKTLLSRWTATWGKRYDIHCFPLHYYYHHNNYYCFIAVLLLLSCVYIFIYFN